MEMIDRVLNDKEGRQVTVQRLPETAGQTEYQGKVYTRKEKDGEFTSDDFFESDEPSMMMRNLARPRMLKPLKACV